MFDYVVPAKDAGGSDKLPVGAIVGIVISVVVAFLISLVVLLVLSIRYRCKLNFISFFAWSSKNEKRTTYGDSDSAIPSSVAQCYSYRMERRSAIAIEWEGTVLLL